MVYMAVCCVAITIAYAVSSYCAYKERRHLVELLAAKDYADYKNFEKDEPSKEHSNMFSKRESVIKQRASIREADE